MFPKFVYQKDEKAAQGFAAKLVNSQEELDSLEGKWEDSPAKFGIETHPNPIEKAELAEKAAESKKSESKKAKA